MVFEVQAIILITTRGKEEAKISVHRTKLGIYNKLRNSGVSDMLRFLTVANQFVGNSQKA